MFIDEIKFSVLEKRINSLENKLGESFYNMRGVVRSELTGTATLVEQADMQFGMYTGLCVDTIDIWKQNKIRWYSPLFHNPTSPIAQLPWADAISSMGGFGDCGLTWIPPAGSTVCIVFENGNRSSPFYIGTTWHRNRGVSPHNWGINIEEYKNVSEGHRNGYMVGPDDGSQVLPPWNTENYNGFDLSSQVDFSENPEAQKLITYPNIYGFRTPEKHTIKMVDGDPKCARKWKRFEILSSCGNWIMLKDDHLHYAGQWANSECGAKDGETSCVEDANNSSQQDTTATLVSGVTRNDNYSIQDLSPKYGKKKEEENCDGTESNKKIIGGHPSTGHPETKYYQSQVGANPFFKHRQECRPIRGPGTPQNPICDLPQTGIQIMSISGHTFLMDDSVEEPGGEPQWIRATEEFDFGCNNHYVGRCVGANEIITLSNGQRIVAGELCGEEFELLDIDENGEFRNVKAIAEPNIIEPVYKITLDNGLEVVRNSEHPLWTMSRPKINKSLSLRQRKANVKGWTSCKDIIQGEYVAIANNLPAWGEDKISNEDAILLGYLIGDGGFTGVNVKFSQQDNQQLKELKQIVETSFDCRLKKLSEYDYHIASNSNRNSVISLLRTNGLMGCHSRNKKVPDCIFTSSEKLTSLFLSRLFSTDGWESNSSNGCGQIGFCSISKQLVIDVQHLCQKFGIHGKIRLKKIKPSVLVKVSSTAWVFEIIKAEDIILFSEKIGIYGKTKQVNSLVEICKKRKHTRKWMKDQLPATLRWAKIVKIEKLNPELTIAIQVPKTHTFLTGLWEHNTYWQSATGHRIEMSDVESPKGEDGRMLRGDQNYIRLLTATGNKIELNDHTVQQKDCPGCPPNVAGKERGIHLQSTSNHTIDMVDDTNEQCGDCRMNGGNPISKAKKAFIRIRTGYGLEMSYNDDNSQEKTEEQYIRIFCPQKDNKERGPHIHRYQEAPSGPGLVFLRVGGNYIVSTYDNQISIIGDPDKNPSDKIEIISRIKLVYTKDVYLNITDKLHLFYAKEVILLLAGEDCSSGGGGDGGCDGCGGNKPCIAPVLVYDLCKGCVKISDRVFASTSGNAATVSIFMLSPFMKPEPC